MSRQSRRKMDPRAVKAAVLFGGSWVLIGASLAWAAPIAAWDSSETVQGISGSVPQSTTGAWGEWKSPETCSAKNGRVASAEQINTWISSTLVVMKDQGIPGTREGLWRHIKDESGGNPYVCNNWDVNADSGDPSKGLIQVIGTTFRANHCPGTSEDIYDPIANMCAGSHYAWKRYGSIDKAPTPY